MKEELKPCAACGRDAREYATEIVEENEEYVIRCACRYAIWGKTPVEVIDGWNTRLSTYICTECMPPCVIKSDSEPEFCPRGYGIECDECVYNGMPEPVDWQLTEEEK